jgi:hypothetical protein
VCRHDIDGRVIAGASAMISMMHTQYVLLYVTVSESASSSENTA